MIISLIAAMGTNRVIGSGNKMPWHLPDDLQYYLDTTRDELVLLGRVTYEAYRQVMKDHRMLVVTSQTDLERDNITVVHSPDDGIKRAEQMGVPELFVSGGSSVYGATISQADRLYLTLIDHAFEGDRFFPEFDWNGWTEISRRHHPADERHRWGFDYVVLERKRNGV